MRNEELVEKVRQVAKKANISKLVGHIAYQFNIEGEGEGAFYLVIADGKVSVEPYEYYDRDVLIVVTQDVLLKLISGELKPLGAYADGEITVYGDVEQLKMLPFGKEKKKK